MVFCCNWSPSSRGRGLKLMSDIVNTLLTWVALFTRAWIEIMKPYNIPQIIRVALFTRAWIEIK